MLNELVKNAIDGASVYHKEHPSLSSGPDITIRLDIIQGKGIPYIDFQITNSGKIDYDGLRKIALSKYNGSGGENEGIWVLELFGQKFGYFFGKHNEKLRIIDRKSVV